MRRRKVIPVLEVKRRFIPDTDRQAKALLFLLAARSGNVPSDTKSRADQASDFCTHVRLTKDNLKKTKAGKPKRKVGNDRQDE